MNRMLRFDFMLLYLTATENLAYKSGNIGCITIRVLH